MARDKMEPGCDNPKSKWKAKEFSNKDYGLLLAQDLAIGSHGRCQSRSVACLLCVLAAYLLAEDFC